MIVLYLLPWLLLVLLVYYTYTIQASTRKMPPGPFVVPFGLGSLPEIFARKPFLRISELRPWEVIDMISKKYGDIISCQWFTYDIVFLTSYEILTEIANMEEYNMKFAHKMFTYPRTFGKEMGLVFAASTPLWTEMRKFTLRTLRTFGFGKEYTMHSIITDEAQIVSKEFQKKMKSTGGIIKIRNTFSLTVLNVLWCMVAGIRYEHDDPKLLKFMDLLFQAAKCSTFGNPRELVYPIAMKIAPMLFKEEFRYKFYDECHELMKSLVDERKAKGMYLTDEPQNYIDVFLKKIHDSRKDKNSLYTEQQLQAMLADLLLVGTLTLNSTLSYGILFLTLNPKIQERCQAEIDSAVPSHSSPTMNDIEKMPFFQAFMLEVHRCANVVPNPVPRIAPNDFTLRGYHIPKGALIFSNHYSVNKNENIWGDPDVFRPDRFINEKGEFAPDPRVVAFGFGKRICIGVTLVNAILPLFFAKLLHDFTFSVVEGGEIPTLEPAIGVSLSPKEFPVHLRVRHASSNE